MIGALSLIGLIVLPRASFAHAFDERYDLPIPLSFFICGAILIVLFTYLLAILFVKEDQKLKQWISGSHTTDSLLFHIPLILQALVNALVIFSLCFIILLSFFGPSNPLMNMASHFIWVNWWVGVPLLFAMFGSMMHGIDPFQAIATLCKTESRVNLSRSLINLMAALGRWPAVIGLLYWCWIEVVYPNAALPKYLGVLVTMWLISGIIGRMILGNKGWNENWDFFRIYFSYFGNISPLYRFKGSVYIGKPFVRLIQDARPYPGNVAFVIAMLSTVLFDGLHSSPVWLGFQTLFEGRFDNNGYFLGFLGVLLVWAFFYFVFLGTCLLVPQNSHAKIGGRLSNAMYIAEIFAPTLIPIALAYHIAHNFSSLIIQGQNIFILSSDPLNQGWNLFGTANFYPNISILDAKTVWYVALISIVIGHVVSIFLTHLVAIKEFKNSAIAGKAVFPLTILMILFTAVSLMILAEPLVS